jgi:nucleoside-triphosphatase THEP1
VETRRPPEVPRVMGTELERRFSTVQEFLGSPASFLASFFSRKKYEHNLILVTGASGSGKTTWCEALVDQARQMGFRPEGLLSPPVYEDGCKTGIDLLDLKSQARRRLAWQRSSEAAVQSGPATVGWQFDPHVLAWGDRLLRELVGRHPDLLVLDEIGPLELERGQGLQSGLRLIDERGYRLACVVVRPALLPVAGERWPWGKTLAISAQTFHEAPA